MRLSQALARLRLAKDVIKDDVDEALRLIEVSKSSLYENDPHAGSDRTASSKIYHVVRSVATVAGKEEVRMSDLRDRVLAKGFTNDQFVDCIAEYEELNVWQVSSNGTRLVFINAEDGEDEDVEMAG